MSDTCEICGWWKKFCKCEKDSSGRIYVHTFTPHVYEDLDIHPIEVTSKRQLKEECKKRGLMAERLM